MSDYRPSNNPAIGWTDEHGNYHHAPGYEPAPCGSQAPHPTHPMPCDSGCQPDWHKDHCAVYGTCRGVRS